MRPYIDATNIDQLVQKYMRGDCLYFASALAEKLGLPVGRLVTRKGGGLAHAFLILEKVGLPSDWKCFDVEGHKTLGEIRNDCLETHGPTLLAKDVSPHAEDQFSGPYDDLIKSVSVIPAVKEILDAHL